MICARRCCVRVPCKHTYVIFPSGDSCDVEITRRHPNVCSTRILSIWRAINQRYAISADRQRCKLYYTTHIWLHPRCQPFSALSVSCDVCVFYDLPLRKRYRRKKGHYSVSESIGYNYLDYGVDTS